MLDSARVYIWSHCSEAVSEPVQICCLAFEPNQPVSCREVRYCNTADNGKCPFDQSRIFDASRSGRWKRDEVSNGYMFTNIHVEEVTRSLQAKMSFASTRRPLLWERQGEVGLSQINDEAKATAKDRCSSPSEHLSHIWLAVHCDRWTSCGQTRAKGPCACSIGVRDRWPVWMIAAEKTKDYLYSYSNHIMFIRGADLTSALLLLCPAVVAPMQLALPGSPRQSRTSGCCSTPRIYVQWSELAVWAATQVR